MAHLHSDLHDVNAGDASYHYGDSGVEHACASSDDGKTEAIQGGLDIMKSVCDLSPVEIALPLVREAKAFADEWLSKNDPDVKAKGSKRARNEGSGSSS